MNSQRELFEERWPEQQEEQWPSDPVTQLLCALDRMKITQREAELADDALVEFLEHQVERYQKTIDELRGAFEACSELCVFLCNCRDISFGSANDARKARRLLKEFQAAAITVGMIEHAPAPTNIVDFDPPTAA